MSAAARIGIDVGSTTTKAVVVDDEGKVIARAVEPTRPRMAEQCEAMIGRLREDAGDPSLPVIATGYGRKLVRGAARQITEITCHAKGAFAIVRRGGLLIDMGGQDTKVIRIGSTGRVEDFAMNDKCAAGTGRFLEVIVPRLDVPWEKLRETYRAAPRRVAVSSTCTVFAESEVISLVANGEPVEGIVRGLHDALADRVASMASRLVQGAGDVLLSGGVAHNGAMIDALAARMGLPVTVVEEPVYVGALGAALAG